jgi:hypothetical protein
MGKAGILEEERRYHDSNAHINEGTADNYFFENELLKMFEGTILLYLQDQW